MIGLKHVARRAYARRQVADQDPDPRQGCTEMDAQPLFKLDTDIEHTGQRDSREQDMPRQMRAKSVQLVAHNDAQAASQHIACGYDGLSGGGDETQLPLHQRHRSNTQGDYSCPRPLMVRAATVHHPCAQAQRPKQHPGISMKKIPGRGVVW